MDPVSTPRAQMSLSGRMHDVAFLLGVPSMVLAALLLSLTLGRERAYESRPLMTITTMIWLSLVLMIAIMLKAGPGKPPVPTGRTDSSVGRTAR